MDGGVWFAGEVVEAAGVRPVFRLCDEAPFNGVGVHVVEFLETLLRGENVEVVVARLPELFPSDLFRDGELEGLEGFGERIAFRFA